MASQQRTLHTGLVLLTTSTLTLAQGGGFGGYGGGNNGNGGSNNGGGGSSNNPFSSGDNGFRFGAFNFSHAQVIVTAHAVLGTLAFAFFFPIGGIIIRLASFPGLWWVHGLVQIFAYMLYIAAFGLGVYITQQSPIPLLSNRHPIIGIILLALLFFQPILGLLHHTFFRKQNRRMVWSYAHIWLGRIVITLGIINGGLGLQLAQKLPIARPSQGAVIAYGVLAGLMWLVYVVSIFVGEGRRRRGMPPRYKEGVGRKVEYA